MATTVPAFDTLSYARRLKEAGVDEAQAEAHAEAVRDAVTEGVATKADIVPLDAKIVHLDAKIDAVKAELGTVKWVLGFLAALTLAMAARLFGVF